VVGTEVGSREGDSVGVWVGLMLGACRIDAKVARVSEAQLYHHRSLLLHQSGPGKAARWAPARASSWAFGWGSEKALERGPSWAPSIWITHAIQEHVRPTMLGPTNCDGPTYGLRVGSSVGRSEGDMEGSRLGAMEGSVVGLLVGNSDGACEGLSVGTSVGVIVGRNVGLCQNREEFTPLGHVLCGSQVIHYHNTDLRGPSRGSLGGRSCGRE
jgi:hypothetical protein